MQTIEALAAPEGPAEREKAGNQEPTGLTAPEKDRAGVKAQLPGSLENLMENYTPMAAGSDNPAQRKLFRIPETAETVLEAVKVVPVLPVLSLSVTRGRWHKWQKQWRLFQTALSQI